MVKNPHLKIALHKLKQRLTPLYDRFIVRQAMDQKLEIIRGLREYLATRRISTIQIANVNKCNAHCVFCGQHKFSRAKGVMSDPMFISVASEAQKLGVSTLDFTPTLGDPLLDPSLEFKLHFANYCGFNTQMTTNGILLAADFDEPKFPWIAKYCGLTRISIGALDRENYRKAYGVDKYDDVITGILSLLFCIQSKDYSSKVHLFFRSGLSPKELISSPDWGRLYPYVKAGILTYEFTNYYDNWGGAIHPHELIGEMKPRTEKAKIGLPCFSLKAIFIEHQGNVRLCGCRFKDKEQDDLVIGTISDSRTLTDILAADNQYKLYNRFMSGPENLPDICVGCSLYRPLTLNEFRS